MTALRIKSIEEKLQKLQDFIDKLEELKLENSLNHTEQK